MPRHRRRKARGALSRLPGGWGRGGRTSGLRTAAAEIVTDGWRLRTRGVATAALDHAQDPTDRIADSDAIHGA